MKKRILTGLMAALLAASFASCGNNSTSTSASTESSKASESTSATEEASAEEWKSGFLQPDWQIFIGDELRLSCKSA